MVSNAGDSPDISYSPDNPQEKPIEQQQAELQIPDEYKKLMVDTITMYRGQWAPERLMRIPEWTKNALMYRGQQVLGWDQGQNTYFDALAWWKKEGRADGADTYLERYINNITQMLGDSFIGTMSRGIPPTIVQPENAEILADVTTAKAAQEAISIIERMNRIHQLVRVENSLLYLYGVYFKYTRAVLDGEWAGWDDIDLFGTIQTTKPDRWHCFACGTDVPAASGRPKQCPTCGRAIGDEAFYESETSTQTVQTGTQKVPKAMVRWDVYGPLEFDSDPNAKRLEHSPICSLDLDVDVGSLRATFPTMAEDIEEGAQLSTTPNADYEKLRRAEITAQTANFSAESQNYNATYSRNWMQPASYWKLGNREFAEWMQTSFPRGCKVSIIGDKVVDVRAASLNKEWSDCRLRENVGQFPPSIADNVVPFNERFNDTMDLIDDWIERCAAGMTIYDKSKIDSREMAGRSMAPGILNGITTKGMGQQQPLAESIYQFKFDLAQQIFTYPSLLLNFCELISGVVPQSFGGGSQENIETKGGQEQALDTALTKFNIYWENEKEEHAVASQNAIECLQGLLKAGACGELWEVIQSNGAEFRNNYVNLDKMRGRIKVYPDTDEGLPQSPAQIREVMTKLVEEAGAGNQIALELMEVVSNQELFMGVLAPPGTVVPKAAQRSKTQQDINTLMEKPWILSIDPQSGQKILGLPVKPQKFEDFPTLRDTMRLYQQENFDYQKTNPAGWQRLEQFTDLAEQMEEQVATVEAQRQMRVKMAGMPPQPGPDPTVQAAQQLLFRDAADEVTNLQQMSHLPPAMTKGTISGQVSAAQGIVKSALDLAKLTTKK
jgi:hypothetical protein